jgi:effector-binding domain-containing protein
MKKVLYVIIGLIVLYLILCLVGPKQITVTRSTSINAPVDMVKAKMADLKFFQEQWSPWTERDPQMKVTYLGEMGQPGYGYSWTGNKEVGTGTLVITGISGDTLLQKLTFEGMGDSKTYFVVNGTDAATNVTWGIQMEIGFMGRAVMLFMNMDKMMGADFEHGLDKLKKAIESMPATSSATTYDVKEVDFPETNLIGTKKQRLTMDKVGPFFGENLGKIMGDMKKNKIEPMSAPSGLYYNFNDADMSADVVACFTAPKGAKIKGWENYEFPAGKAVMLAYHGGYNDMMAAHNAIKDYIKEKNLTPLVSLEEYVSDPMMEKDSTKWLTNIYYILAPSK